MSYESIEDPLTEREREVTKPSAKRWGLVGVAATLMLLGAAAITGSKVLPRLVPDGTDVARSVDGVETDAAGTGSASARGLWGSMKKAWGKVKDKAEDIKTDATWIARMPPRSVDEAAARGLWGSVKKAWGKTKEKSSQAWDKVMDKAEDMKNKATYLSMLPPRSVEGVDADSATAARGLWGSVKKAWGKAKEKAKNAWDSWTDKAEDAWDRMKSNPSLEKAKSVVKDLKEQGKDAFEKAMERTKTLKGDAKKFMEEAIALAKSHDVLDKLMDRFNDLKDKGEQFSDQVKKKMHEALDKMEGDFDFHMAIVTVNGFIRYGQLGLEQVMMLVESLPGGKGKALMLEALERAVGAQPLRKAMEKYEDLKEKFFDSSE